MPAKPNHAMVTSPEKRVRVDRSSRGRFSPHAIRVQEKVGSRKRPWFGHRKGVSVACWPRETRKEQSFLQTVACTTSMPSALPALLANQHRVALLNTRSGLPFWCGTGQ
jgi:hypothetical protein